MFGLAVHHAVRARFCIERERSWQAEHWLTGLREEAHQLAVDRFAERIGRERPARAGDGARQVAGSGAEVGQSG